MNQKDMLDAAASLARSPRSLIVVGAPGVSHEGAVRYCDAEIDLMLVADKFWLALAKSMAPMWVKEKDDARSTLPATLFGAKVEFYDARRHDPIIAATIRRSVSRN